MKTIEDECSSLDSDKDYRSCVNDILRDGLYGHQRKPTAEELRRRPTTAPAYRCDLCEKKLRTDIASGWASARFRSYVSQAIAGYDNCKRKAGGSCDAGDVLVKTIEDECSSLDSDKDYRSCVNDILKDGLYGHQRKPTAEELRRRSTTAPAYRCDLCEKKLRADIASGWASVSFRSYVGQAIAGYDNCKRKAGGSCDAGDVLVKTIEDECSSLDSDKDYRSCVNDILRGGP